MSSVNAGHYVLGTEGLALLRGWLAADGPQLERRVEELKRFATRGYLRNAQSGMNR